MRTPLPEECQHEGWECRGGWHECNDCGVGLGSRDNVLEKHNAVFCDLCGEGSPVLHILRTAVSPQQDEMDVPYGDAAIWVTKDSGKREEFDSGMVRDTQEGKARWDLLFPKDVPYNRQFLTRVAELLARGAEKYADRNWEQAKGEVELARFQASAMRHMVQWMAGEADEDHASAVVFNLLGYETTKWKLDNGTRD